MTARIVVENCEPRPGEWLWLEYKHAAEIDPTVVFTAVRDEDFRKRLSRLAEVHDETVRDIFSGKHVLILDPKATEPLTTADFDRADAIVVGGILGGETFDGRTERLITKPLKAQARHLGPIQLPVDVAVIVAGLIREGEKLGDIEITNEVEIVRDDEHTTTLPYGYPVVNGKVLITPGLVEHILSH